MDRTFEYRLYPTRAQEARFVGWLDALRRLHNACLQQRRTAWREQGRSVSRFDQEAEVSGVRAALPEYGAVYSHVVQEAVRRVDLAFQAFFRRVEAWEAASPGLRAHMPKPGYPRFKGRNRYDSFAFKQPGNGCVRVDGRRVRFSKLAPEGVRFFQHRPIRGRVARVTVKRRAGKWFVQFSCRDVPPDSSLKVGSGECGVDMGVSQFATLDSGESFANPAFGEAALKRLRRAHRTVSRRRLGSNRRREAVRVLQRHYQTVRNQRRDHAAKWARGMVQRFGFIAVEGLDLRRMASDAKRPGLHRRLHDAAIRRALEWLGRKAEEAGAQVVKVEPAGTSRACSGCGHEKDALPLWVRTYECRACGLVLGRDENAAKNILARARAQARLAREGARTGPPWREPVAVPVEAGSPRL